MQQAGVQHGLVVQAERCQVVVHCMPHQHHGRAAGGPAGLPQQRRHLPASAAAPQRDARHLRRIHARQRGAVVQHGAARPDQLVVNHALLLVHHAHAQERIFFPVCLRHLAVQGQQERGLLKRFGRRPPHAAPALAVGWEGEELRMLRVVPRALRQRPGGVSRQRLLLLLPPRCAGRRCCCCLSRRCWPGLLDALPTQVSADELLPARCCRLRLPGGSWVRVDNAVQELKQHLKSSRHEGVRAGLGLRLGRSPGLKPFARLLNGSLQAAGLGELAKAHALPRLSPCRCAGWGRRT